MLTGFDRYAGSGPVRWELLPTEAETRHFLGCYAAAAAGTETAPEEAVCELMAEVELFFPASQLFWGLWGTASLQPQHSGPNPGCSVTRWVTRLEFDSRGG